MTEHAATHYRIAVLDPAAHLFEVRCTVDTPAAGGQRFRLPRWVPGSYLIREFARHFVDVRAMTGASGAAVPIAKEDASTWRAAPCTGPLTVIARIYAFDLSVRTAYLDTTRGYFNGGAVFLCPDGREHAPCTLEIVPPDAAACVRWRCATTMTRADPATWRFHAADYDELIDHPVELSEFAACEFAAGGVPHQVAITGRHAVDTGRLQRDLARVCQWQIDLFGGTPPFPAYLFLVMAVGDGYGGLEHRSSTSLLCSRNGLPQAGMAEPTDDYVTFLGLASHEYFHAWNVKRIKPAAFVPYDLSRESYTRQLWAFEGITSYYDDLALVRSGVVGDVKFLELLGRGITTVLRTPGRLTQSIADASFDAWIKFYRQDENSPNALVSYYAKGALVALALDLQLRVDGRVTLDDVMRALWERHGATGVGVPEGGIEALASELAGRDLGDFFARYVHGTEDPPLASLLAAHGVTLELRAAAGAKDRGGKPAPAGAQAAPRTWLGAKVGGDLRLQHVYAGGPAERAGLAAGDALVALGGIRASAEALDRLAERGAAGTRLAVHVFRRDELMAFDVEIAAAPLDTAFLTLAADAPPDVRARRAAWLGARPATA